MESVPIHPGQNPFHTMTHAFSSLFRSTGRIIDDLGGQIKAFASYGTERSSSIGPVQSNISNETKTEVVVGTKAEEFFTPYNNQPSSPTPFTLDINTTNETKVTLSTKVTIKAVDIHTKNVTSSNSSTGEVVNSTTVTVGKDQTGLFVKTDSKENTTGGVRTEQKLSAPNGVFIKFSGQLSIGN